MVKGFLGRKITVVTSPIVKLYTQPPSVFKCGVVVDGVDYILYSSTFLGPEERVVEHKKKKIR